MKNGWTFQLSIILHWRTTNGASATDVSAAFLIFCISHWGQELNEDKQPPGIQGAGRFETELIRAWRKTEELQLLDEVKKTSSYAPFPAEAAEEGG